MVLWSKKQGKEGSETPKTTNNERTNKQIKTLLLVYECPSRGPETGRGLSEDTPTLVSVGGEGTRNNCTKRGKT